MCLLWQTVLLREWEDGELDRGKGCREAKHCACLSVFKLLLAVAVAHDGEEHAVNADGCLDDVWSVGCVVFWVEVFYLLARVLCVL